MQSNQPNDMQQLQSRSEQLINSITDAITSTVEVAAERLQLAAEISRITQRMSAFSSVLEMLNTQKGVIQAEIDKLQGNTTALKSFYQKQLEILAAQEIAVLQKIGVSPELAQLAVKDDGKKEDEKLYKREGKRFVEVIPAEQP